jgi:hypothetical protein
VYPFLVLALIGGIYGIFLYVELVPQLERLQLRGSDMTVKSTDPHVWKASPSEVVWISTIFHILFFLFLVSFFRAIFTHPGSIPKTKKWRRGKFDDIHVNDQHFLRILVERGVMPLNDPEGMRKLRAYLRRHPLVERKKNLNGKYGVRFCRRCKLYKPDRTHHCSVCHQCILRMDHHCPWIANCVGYHNHKFFLLAIFYAIMSVDFLMLAMIPRFLKVFEPITDTEYYFTKDALVLVLYLACLALSIVLSIFFGFHMMLVFNSMTTIEYKEKFQPRESTNQNLSPEERKKEEAGTRHRFDLAHLKFDYSIYLNALHVFGPWYMWLIPASPPPFHRDPETGLLTHTSDPEPGCYYSSPQGMMIFPIPDKTLLGDTADTDMSSPLGREHSGLQSPRSQSPEPRGDDSFV